LEIISLNNKNKKVFLKGGGGVDRRANSDISNYITDANHALKIRTYIEKLKNFKK
jgi:hypothetical protein